MFWHVSNAQIALPILGLRWQLLTPSKQIKNGIFFFSFFSFIDWTPLCTVRSICWYQSSKAPPRNILTLIMVTSVPLHHCHTHNHSKDALWLYCLLPLLVPQCVTSSNIYLETCPTWKTGVFTDLRIWGLKRAGSTHIQNILGEDWIPFAGNRCLLFERRVAEIPAVLSASRLLSIIDVVL